MKNIKMGVAALGVTVALATGAAFAATQNFTATVKFATPLSLTKVTDLNFGVLKANTEAIYNMSFSGVITTTSPGEVISGTGSSKGQLNIVGSPTQTIDIGAFNYTAQGGVTPSGAVCSYAGTPSGTDCEYVAAAAPGAGKTLNIGLKIAVNGLQNNGATATPTFDIVVVYN